MREAVVESITVYPLAIPFRETVRHATSERRVSESVVVEVRLRDGTEGFGETLPRSYVTGETVSTVLDAVESVFIKSLTTFHAHQFAEALEQIDELPWETAAGIPIPAARAAVEMAMLDAVLDSYGRSIDDVTSWLGLPGFGSPGSSRSIRFSGVLAAESLPQTMRQLRKMYWGGLRQFKLKVGFDGDKAMFDAVSRYLRKPIERGRASLRLDLNGAWTIDAARKWLKGVDQSLISAIEQPFAPKDTSSLAQWTEHFDIPVIHDESLITIDDARRLVDLCPRGGFNIRLSKCGGLLPSLKLAALARRHSQLVQLGCMVGETSLLARMGLQFLEVCPHVTWAEGCFGNRLLTRDSTAKSLLFGYGGRPPKWKSQPLMLRVGSLEECLLITPKTHHL